MVPAKNPKISPPTPQKIYGAKAKFFPRRLPSNRTTLFRSLSPIGKLWFIRWGYLKNNASQPDENNCAVARWIWPLFWRIGNYYFNSNLRYVLSLKHVYFRSYKPDQTIQIQIFITIIFFFGKNRITLKKEARIFYILPRTPILN